MVVGTDAGADNAAKQRPAGLSVAGLGLIAPYLDLAGGGLARWLGDGEHVSMMAPVRPGARA